MNFTHIQSAEMEKRKVFLMADFGCSEFELLKRIRDHRRVLKLDITLIDDEIKDLEMVESYLKGCSDV